MVNIVSAVPLSEERKDCGVDDGSLSMLSRFIISGYETGGIAGATGASVVALAGTIIPIAPAQYAIDKHNQFKEDETINHKKHFNAQDKAFNKLRQSKALEEHILSKQKKLKQQEDEGHWWRIDYWAMNTILITLWSQKSVISMLQTVVRCPQLYWIKKIKNSTHCIERQ
eukprot:813640_1